MKSLLSLVVSLALAGTLAAKDPETKAKDPDGSIHVGAKAADSLVKEKDKAKKVEVLDIRTPAEYEEGHIEGATNIDFLDASFEKAVEKLDRDKPYLVHCQSGRRSGRSLEVFNKFGFTNIYHLDGGIKEWVKAGYPVAGKEKPKDEAEKAKE